MYTIKLKRPLLTAVLLSVVAMLFALSIGSSPTLAQETINHLREVRTFENNDIGSANPVGLTFSLNENAFFVLDTPIDRRTNIVMLTPHSHVLGRISLDSALADNINITFDDHSNQLLFFKATSQELVKISVDTERTYSIPTPTIMSFDNLDLQDPRGLVIDPSSGQLVFLDSSGQQLVFVTVSNESIATGTSRTNLKHIDVTDARGLTHNPINDHFYFLSPSQQKAFEITRDGQLITTFDLTAFDFTSPQTIVIAPSGDLTDDTTIMSLYIVDKAKAYRADNDYGGQSIQPTIGRIVELSMTEPVPRLLSVPTDVATLVNLTETSQFSPPSPDPAGLAYLSNSNSLLISDSEVNEMPIFAGYNLFQTTLSGVLIDTFSSTSFSDEPTDIAYSPNNDHLFITDDSGNKGIYELNPGPDGLYNTGDDTTTFFSTEDYGSTDPEGVSVNTGNGHLFFTDGLNREVYKIDPGPNGIFDGAPPGGDDIMTHFDVAVMGVEDPEGSAFNWHNGHLYVLSKNEMIAEMTTDGTLLRYIDISSLDARRLAGIVYAPASTDPNQYHMYIVARGIDNGQDPNENDGKMYEVSFPNNNLPVVDAGADQVTPNNSISLDGTVSDDGLPDPPGAVTTAWSKVSGPGTVTFGNASAVDTTATFSTTGIYVLRLTADDGQIQGSDEISVTILPSGPNQPPTVDAGLGQAITLPDAAALDGTVVDDGLPYPPSAVAVAWSKVSGPGAVTFANANAEDTTVTFSAAGVYVLRLTADDSELTANDEVTITVAPPPPQTTIEVRINSSSDDARRKNGWGYRFGE